MAKRRKGRADANRPKPRWEKQRKALGRRAVLCRKCGRVDAVLAAVVMESKATGQPIRCVNCGGTMMTAKGRPSAAKISLTAVHSA